jgi:hypothetical protein
MHIYSLKIESPVSAPQGGVRLTFPEPMRPCAVIQRHQFLLIFKAKCSPKTATFR